MSPERWTEVRAIYDGAIEQPSSQVEAFLRQACRGDDELYGEVQRLLAHRAQPAMIDRQLFTAPQPGTPGSPAMDPAQWERVRQVFYTAIAAGPERSTQVLNLECRGEPELAREIQPLVDQHFRAVKARGDAVASHALPDDSSMLAGRFRVISRLGGGGFGDVYRVVDERLGGEQLALKVLRSSDPLALHYFKREFRSLAGIFHRNIVTLHELIASEGRWMFTMEFVDGLDWLRYLEAQSAKDREAALRSCLPQLAEGLTALHKRNLLHRDVKPSNVLITADGRVVLLDFGLVRAFGDEAQGAVSLAGTPNYMSPEQISGAPIGEASDWYAVGVMLYQSLTGRVPFDCRTFEGLRLKQTEPPIPPVKIVRTAPAPLNELCLKLLATDPSKRASYEDVIRLVHPAPGVAVREPAGTVFVGRERMLRQLAAAYSTARERPVVVHLRGPSGIGKTVLLREFLRQLAREPDALVFAGRCHEGESVPYQALDELIDYIGQFFRRSPVHVVEQFLPRNFAVLVKMFPALAPFVPADVRPGPRFDTVELRARALSALREMLGRFSEHHRVVLVIDDLQWGDADGCAALNDLLSSNDWPPVLTVLAYRSEDIEASAPLKALCAIDNRASGRETHFIDLDHLEEAEALDLAERLLAAPRNSPTVRSAVEQSGGNPFLLQEIARWVNARGAIGDPSLPFSLADVVGSRLADLAPETRRFLELVALTGQPTQLSILQLAGKIQNVHSARDKLMATRFVRLRMARGREEVEIYHDRIRAPILAAMDPAVLVLRHRDLGRAMAAAGYDPERIAAHFEQAHEAESCARYALLAARKAVEVLAFNKASRFFEMALATRSLDANATRMAHRECADALANAGLGPRAAEHYLAACDGADIDHSLEWNLRAAEQLLFSGHVDQGLAIFRTVLRQVGLRFPEPASRFPIDLLLLRARLRLRGLRWRERAAAEVPRALLLKADTCASVAIGLALIDVARGAALQTTSLMLALSTGEPTRVARALAMEAAYRSTAGVKAAAGAEKLLAQATALAESSGDPRAIGLAAAMSAGCAWNAGRWLDCYQSAALARETLRERHERVTWERDTASIFEVDALRWMGRWSEMKFILPELVEDARQRGDLYALSILQMHGGSCAELANDDPARARAGLKLLEQWSNTGFHVEHLIETHNQVEISLYLGNGAEALDLILQRWPAIRGSLLLRVQTFAIQMHCLRARAALGAAAAASAEKRRELLRFAGKETRAIRRKGAKWGELAIELIQGGIEALSGSPERALATFARAEKLADGVGMLLHAAAARRSRGLLLEGAGSHALVGSADETMSKEGVVNPERLAAVIAPCRPIGIH